MDDRIALIHRAAEVQRQIFASLPWNIRFALVWSRLALDCGEVAPLGRLLGMYMLLAGVTGMPPTGDKWNPAKPNPGHLPPNYLSKFMCDLLGLLVKKYDVALAHEAIENFLLRLKDGKTVMKPLPLHSAQSWVTSGVLWQAADIQRTKKKEQLEESMQDQPDEAKLLTKDIADPRAMKQFEHRNPKLWNQWMAYLEKHVHPDIKLYFELRMDGKTDKEIVGWPNKGIPSMLPHWTKGGPQNWNQNYGPEIIRRSREFLGDLSPAEMAELYSESAPAIVPELQRHHHHSV